MKWAVYRLKHNSPSFDCLTFMQVALGLGTQGVWIIEGSSGWGGYGGEEGQKKRFEEIVKPIVKLYGLEMVVSENAPTDKEVVWPAEGMSPHEAHAMGNIAQLKKVFPLMPSKEAYERIGNVLGGKRPIVFATRSQPYQDLRNTTEGQIRWANEVGAVIIPDDISLDDRVAYYEHASLVVSSNGGNMMPAVYTTHRPYLILKQIFNEYKATGESFFRRNGLIPGYQYPWGGKHQYIAWEATDTTYKATCAVYATYNRRLNDPNLP